MYPTNNTDIINSDIQEEKPAEIFEELYQESLITEQPTKSELHNVQYEIHLKKAKVNQTFKGYKKVKNIIENQKSKTNKRNSNDSASSKNNKLNTNSKDKITTRNVTINDDIDDNANLNNNIVNNQIKSKNKSLSSTTYPSKNTSFIHSNMKKNSTSTKISTDNKNNDEKNSNLDIDVKIISKQKSRAARSSLQPRSFYSGSRALTTHRSLTNITMNATKKMKEEATKRAVLLNEKNDLQMEINKINKANKAEIQSLKREIEKLTEENIKYNRYSTIVGPTIDPQYASQLRQVYGDLNFDYLQSIVEIRQNAHQNYEDEVDSLNRINDALFIEYEKKFPAQSFRNINIKYNNINDDEYYYTSSDSESTSYSASIGSPDDYFTASSIDHQKRNEVNFKQKLEDERKKKESRIEKKNAEEEQDEGENQNEIQNKEEKTESQNEADDKDQNLNEEEEQKENNGSKDNDENQNEAKNDQISSQTQNQNTKDSKTTNSTHSSYYSTNNSLSNNIEILPKNNKSKINTNSNSSSSSGDRKRISNINDLNKDIINDFSKVFSKIKPRSNSMGNFQSKDYGDEDEVNNDEEKHSDFSNNSSNSNRYVNSDYQDLGPEYEQGFQDVDDEIHSLPRTSSEENEVHDDKKEVKFAEINEESKAKPRIIDTYSDELSSDFNQNKNNNNISIIRHSSSILKSENDSDYIVHFERIKKPKNPDSSTQSEVDIMDIKLPTLEVTSNPTSGSNDRFNKHRYAFNMSDAEYSSEYLRNKLEKERLEKLQRKLQEEEEEDANDQQQQQHLPEPEPEKKKRKKRKRKSNQQRNANQFVIDDVKKYIEEDNKRLKNEITDLKYQNIASNTQKIAKRKEVFDVISLKPKSNKELEISAEIIRLQNRDLVEKINEIEKFIQDEEELIQRFIALQTQIIRNPTAEANQALQSRLSLIKKDSMRMANDSKSEVKSEKKSVTKMSRRSSGSTNRSTRSKEKRRSLKLYDVSEKARETFMQLEKARQNLNDTIEKAKYLLNDLEKDEELCDKKTAAFLTEASEDAAFYIRIQIENERIESELKNIEEEALRVSRRFGGVPSGKGTRRAILSLKRTMSTLINRNQNRAMETLQAYVEKQNELKAREESNKAKEAKGGNENENESKQEKNSAADSQQSSNENSNENIDKVTAETTNNGDDENANKNSNESNEDDQQRSNNESNEDDQQRNSNESNEDDQQRNSNESNEDDPQRNSNESNEDDPQRNSNESNEDDQQRNSNESNEDDPQRNSNENENDEEEEEVKVDHHDSNNEIEEEEEDVNNDDNERNENLGDDDNERNEDMNDDNDVEEGDDDK